jgi:glycosyltransferase involved in cell wall biosynthesis/tetratricopeptide (TPR) repeat protein
LVEKFERNPDVSVVVVVYNMAREAPRTLHSLSAAYQRHIDPDEYEVIVVDNGSDPPLDPKIVDGLSGNFRLIRIDHASPSPAQAVNRGLAEARGEVLGVLIDGARIVTPGLLHFARHGACLHEHAVVVAPGWYLGSDFQRWAMQCGYDQAREDALLAAIGWPQDGYRLFEIATPDESSSEGWLQPLAEANALFMRRRAWDTLGGVDERFDAPGGGFVNADTYARAMELPDAELVLLLGEGTFHQLHGGIATNVSPQQFRDSNSTWEDQYEKIRGHRYQNYPPTRPPMYVGTLPRPALAHFVRAATAPIRGHSTPPLGAGFDQRLWSPSPPPRPTDPVVAALVDLAQKEFALGHYAATVSISRLARSRAPDEGEPQRLLSLTACAKVSDQDVWPSAEFYHALGEARRLLGDHDLAASHYRQALELNRNFEPAHVGLATLRLPGDLYYAWLERFHRFLSPAPVIEIGVAEGASLALVPPRTMAIAVDPNPRLTQPLWAETHIFHETSEAFFARGGPDALLAGRPLGVGFIDGLHLYEQALRDFIHLEAYCDSRSVILLHDTLPLDEATQSRARDTGFHTGDVWKIVLCLKHYRPDLEIFTIATPRTGLTVVTRLDPQSRVLEAAYEEAVARFISTPYAEIEHNLEVALNVVPNDVQVVEARLMAREVLQMDRLAPDAIARISLDVGTVPSEVGVSEMFWIDVTVCNATNRPLAGSPPFPVLLAYHWIEESTRQMVVFEGHRSEFFPRVQANDSKHCWMRVVAPSLPGKYILQTTMVQEAVCWFEDVRPDILQEFEVVASAKQDHWAGTS